MGRSQESRQLVKNQLQDLNLKGVDSPSIYFALNRGQMDLATQYDVLQKQVTLNTIEDQTSYDVFVEIGSNITAGSFVSGNVYSIVTVGTTDFTLIGAASNNIGVIFTSTGVGAGTGTAKIAVDVVRKIKSVKTPSDWVNLYYKTDQQFDQLLMDQPSVSVPTYITYRNKQLVFHGAPTTDDESLVIQVFLHSPTQAISETIQPEVEKYFDQCLEKYAIQFLLPLAHQLKANLKAEYEFFVKDIFGKYSDNFSAPIIPEARW